MVGKKIALAVGTLILSLGLIGCRNTENTKNGASDQPKKVEQVKVIKTEMGEVTVPEKPARVLVNWYVGDVTTLGVKPVAYSGWAQETMPFYEEIKDIPVIKKWEKEEIMSYKPDVIITYSPEDFEKYSKIAPVVVVSEGTDSPLERLKFLGHVLGREKEAETAITTFETKLASAKKQFSTDVFKDKTFSISQDWPGPSSSVFYETASRGGTLLYDYIGLKKPEKLIELVTKTGETRGALSYEVAADYFGDYAIWFTPEEKESEFEKTAIWKNIPAVKNERVITISSNYTGLFYYSDVASLTAQIDFALKNIVPVVS